MSAFASIFGASRAIHAAYHFQEVVFQPADPNRPTETVRAKVGGIDVDLLDGEVDQVKEQRRILEVPISVAEGGPSERQRGGKYLIGTEDWIVRLELSVDNSTGVARLDVRRPVRTDRQGRAERQ